MPIISFEYFVSEGFHKVRDGVPCVGEYVLTQCGMQRVDSPVNRCDYPIVPVFHTVKPKFVPDFSSYGFKSGLYVAMDKNREVYIYPTEPEAGKSWWDADDSYVCLWPSYLKPLDIPQDVDWKDCLWITP